MVPFLVPIGVHRRQKERHDRDGRRAVRVVVKVRDGPRRRAGLDAVLHHRAIRAFEPIDSSSPPTIQMLENNHQRQLPRTRRNTVRSSFVSARFGTRARARARSSAEKRMERLRSGVSGKHT